ncbi:NACHT domain-containing protein [Streptomyces sp. NRRL S-646]|uniref:NACHT domain-containing protein n=1 Tax=Streptomyces sp. NRRL S-646 TaxID=1463917 RepID=UPI000A88E82A|nr:NACHT domain-containing protein [Streptomyces sp. NRRL S-646]
MGASRVRRTALVYVVLLAAAAGLALWLSSKEFEAARLATTAIALVLAAPSAYLAGAAYLADRREAAADIDAKTRTIAAAVAVAEARQRAQLIGPGAHRIDLTFRYRTEPANNAAGADPHGRQTGIVTYYRRVNPARLVITGEPGAGKTLIALDLLLGLLTSPHRTDADPIPVRLSLAGWDTSQPFKQWLAHQVHQHFRDRGITAADALLLVDHHRILPVLDGLDEMDADTAPVGRRRATSALQQLNDYQDPTGNAPVILTCRTTQYEQLAAQDLRMREAARIQIDPVTASQAAAYLTARSANPARWTAVIDKLTVTPGGTLARALNTPWRLNLAVTAYEERHPDTLTYPHDPAFLLTLASSSAVRDHLLDRYVPAASRQHPTHPGRYPSEQAHHWLAAVATHLATGTAATGPTTDIVLHQLWPIAGPRRVRTADALLTTLLLFVCTAFVVTQLPIDSSLGQLFLVGGTAHSAFSTVWQASRPTVPDPKSLQLHQLRGRAQRAQIARELVRGLVSGLLAGLAVGLTLALLVFLTVEPVLALGALLASALLARRAFGLAGELVAPLNDAPPTEPRRALRDDVRVGLTVGFAVGLVTGLAFWLTLTAVAALTVGAAHAFTLGVGLGLGLTLGLTFGLRMAGASRRYMVFLCCARGQLPWRLGAFLHWAYGTGMLRISGMAYQFRHRELQDWLATHPVP